MGDAEKLAAVRAALPSLGAGIQLNTGSAGPMPAEAAAAMAELEAYERDIGRADFAYYLDSVQRMDEARAGVAARVTWTGAVTEQQLIDLYAGALGIVFPPFDEDYGYITLEAFLARKPVITTTDAGATRRCQREIEMSPFLAK